MAWAPAWVKPMTGTKVPRNQNHPVLRQACLDANLSVTKVKTTITFNQRAIRDALEHPTPRPAPERRFLEKQLATCGGTSLERQT